MGRLLKLWEYCYNYGNIVTIMGILLKLWEYCYNYGNNVKIMGIMFIIMRVIIKSFLICFFKISEILIKFSRYPDHVKSSYEMKNIFKRIY